MFMIRNWHYQIAGIALTMDLLIDMYCKMVGNSEPGMAEQLDIEQDEKTEKEECIICLLPIKKHKKTLSCKHIYHKKCIKMWFNHLHCPRCPKCSQIHKAEVIDDSMAYVRYLIKKSLERKPAKKQEKVYIPKSEPESWEQAMGHYIQMPSSKKVVKYESFKYGSDLSAKYKYRDQCSYDYWEDY